MSNSKKCKNCGLVPKHDCDKEIMKRNEGECPLCLLKKGLNIGPVWD